CAGIRPSVTILGWIILTRTTLGRAIYAVGGNREAARISGISFVRTNNNHGLTYSKDSINGRLSCYIQKITHT
ncbi:unnamed protein product, partial [marine sediment metagenome]